MKNHLAARILVRALFGIILLSGSASAHPGHDHAHGAVATHGFVLPAPATAFFLALAAMALLWGILHLTASRVSGKPDSMMERNPS